VTGTGTLVSQVSPSPRPITISGLGTVTFPVSTRSAAAESAFVKGVLLLHLFEYEEAEAQFRAARALDSGMALAYWGEAMTHDHPVWDEEDPAAARAALARYAPTAAQREARAPTPRERGFLHAMDVLFEDGPKARRDTLYSDAMDSLLVRYPGDDEVRTFYALSLLGLSQGVRNVPTYLHAAAIAESVFARNPDHPGAAHLWIHALDDPDHAAQALPAARALATISPDAGHAQHMTSHIFMALGMWDDVVRANVNAQRVVNRELAARGAGPLRCGHSSLWLEYGYLELGRTDSARTVMMGCRERAQASSANPRDPDDSDLGSAVEMWSRYVIDTRSWSGAEVQWTPDFGASRWARATWEFTRGLAAAERGDSSGLRRVLGDFGAARTALLTEMASQPSDPENIEARKRLDVLELELEGEGRLMASLDSGVAILRRATQIEDSMAFAFGPPDVEKPSHELLGDVFLGLARYREAAAEYQAALRKAPGRTTSMEGLARANR
jgi:tetratricopeptide (TPR) repeat protein